jgi:hypothetical protein
MSLLAAQQQALLDALFAWPPQEASQQLLRHTRSLGSQTERGLTAYRSNGHMLAERVLCATYPVLAQMLGEESFADLARAFWHAHPPQRGDMAQWGEAMAAFVRASSQLQAEPYLPDVAQAEWALHRCTSAADRETDLATLELLTREDPQTLALHLAPGLVALSSSWPLASLLLAHLEGQPSFAQVGEQVKSRAPQAVVIWRSSYQAKVRLALEGEPSVLRALQAGQDLATALQAGSELDFSRWLPLAVQTGLVLGARRCPSPIPRF